MPRFGLPYFPPDVPRTVRGAFKRAPCYNARMSDPTPPAVAAAPPLIPVTVRLHPSERAALSAIAADDGASLQFVQRRAVQRALEGPQQVEWALESAIRRAELGTLADDLRAAIRSLGPARTVLAALGDADVPGAVTVGLTGHIAAITAPSMQWPARFVAQAGKLTPSTVRLTQAEIDAVKAQADRDGVKAQVVQRRAVQAALEGPANLGGLLREALVRGGAPKLSDTLAALDPVRMARALLEQAGAQALIGLAGVARVLAFLPLDEPAPDVN